MTHRFVSRRSALCLLLMVFLPVFRVYASETNEAFVRRNLGNFFSEALDRLPLGSDESLLIDFTKPPVDDLNVSGSALYDALRRRGNEVSTPPDSNSAARIRFHLSEVGFSYENRGGNIFSRGDLFRVLKVAGNFTLAKSSSSILEDYLIREYREEIELLEVERLQNDSSPFFNAELPPGPVQKLWEPLIVTSVIGGLVYLFFASR